jgi:hypothetical protein
MRLIGSSDPGAVRRDQLRWHFEERVVLTSSVCRELSRSRQDFASRRPRAALDLLARWMRANYDHPAVQPPRDVDFRHGLDDPSLAEVAADLKLELELGAQVCRDLMMLGTADTPSQFAGDTERLRLSLETYLARIDG